MEKFLPKKIEKEVISMRIPTDTLAELDTNAAAFNISRNEVIMRDSRSLCTSQQSRRSAAMEVHRNKESVSIPYCILSLPD